MRIIYLKRRRVFIVMSNNDSILNGTVLFQLIFWTWSNFVWGGFAIIIIIKKKNISHATLLWILPFWSIVSDFLLTVLLSATRGQPVKLVQVNKVIQVRSHRILSSELHISFKATMACWQDLKTSMYFFHNRAFLHTFLVDWECISFEPI